MEKQSHFEDALSLERSNRYSEAYLLFEQCLRAEEHDRGDILFHLGWCMENGVFGSGAEAIDLYQRAAEQTLFPITRMNALFRAGWLNMQSKQFAISAAFYKKAIDCKETDALDTDIYPHAVYWYAVCLETQGQYLEALHWYVHARTLSGMLDPEARFREIHCRTQIGAYSEALALCRTFALPPAQCFSEERYRELRTLAEQEGKILQALLAENF